MRRGAKPAKAKVEAKPPSARKSRKNDGSRDGALEKRLAEALEREAEALDQQTATSEILGIISRSPADAQPVFDAIAVNALRLCDALGAVVVRYDGELLHVAAYHNVNPEAVDRLNRRYPLAPDRHNPMGRAILDGAVVQVPDLQATEEFSGSVARHFGARGHVSIPLLHRGRAIGAIGISRPTLGPFSDRQLSLLQTFAAQAVIAIENARLFNETKEALEQQTATAEILRVISGSPTDVQPVFDAIAANATQLCGALTSSVFRFDGELIHHVAHDNVWPEFLAAIRSVFPMRPGRGSVTARAVLTRDVVHVQNLAEDPEHEYGVVRRANFGTTLSVPLLRDGAPLGAITVTRAEVAAFSDKEVALLKTFADQAVIAIENVRLFKELQEKNRALTEAHAQVTEALEQQTATSEILRVISQSPTDVQPVFDTIVRSAAQLCHAHTTAVFLTDGRMVYHPASYGSAPEALAAIQARFPRPLDRETAAGTAILTRSVIHVPDVQEPSAVEFARQTGRAIGFRSLLSVPMLRQGEAMGAINVTRREPGPFSDAEVALLKTFADQAVIAIENVRLFNETKEALEQQTATSEILSVISSSPTDVQPVFDAIVRSAVRLCDGLFSSLFQFDGKLLHPVAQHNFTPEALQELHQLYPASPGRAHGSARAILERAVVHIPDVEVEPEYQHLGLTRAVGMRSGLFVPMLREGDPVGVIMVARAKPGYFAETQIALLKTFADQAVIAIENVRLFKELQEKNLALTEAHSRVTEALDQQTAASDILRVISQSPTDVQPVFDALIESATRLCVADIGAVSRLEGNVFRVVLHSGLSEEVRSFWDENPPPLARSSVTGRAALERRTMHVPDILADSSYDYVSDGSPLRKGQVVTDFRAVLVTPMLRDGAVIGTIAMLRREAGPFTESQIKLLETFADQAVIAIENVRLFTELQARTQELTRSVRQLTALGEVGRAVSSTLDLETVLSTIVSRAIQLSGTDGGSVYEYDEGTEEFSLRASRDLPEAYVEQVRDARPRKGEGAVGRVAQTREPVQIVDISDASAYESRVRNTLLQIGLRALLAVPLIAEDRLVGALIVMRKRTGTFAAEEVALLQTFATQSSLAIQNARLFREIEDKSRQLEVASQHKSEFLANMSHELRTPLNAIIGFSEVLGERMFGELNEKQEEYLKDIYASGTHLLSLINDILDLSKIEAGRMELELTDFDLPQAIDNALILVRERAGRRGITLEHSLDERLGEIRGDERKVKQVLLNLLSNALKFTPEGGRVEVRAGMVDGMAEISVTDTGVGIAPEDQGAIFEEFRQVGTAEKKAEGTGLGLTLCRKFVELHGGRIRVASQVGVGSTFTFTIPLRRGESSERDERRP